MFDTEYNRNIRSRILGLQGQHIRNIDMLHDESNGPMRGGKINTKKFFGGLKQDFEHAGHDINQGLKATVNNPVVKPIAKDLLRYGGTALGGLAGGVAGTMIGPEGTAPGAAVGSIIGRNLGNAAANMLGSGIRVRRHLKDTPSITHKGELDYTTKKGDKVHHIDGHDIYGMLEPYQGSGIHHRKIKKHHTKGTKSKTHKGELDYTTKKGDKVHHIDGHDIYGLPAPYSGGSLIASRDLSEGIPYTGGSIGKKTKEYVKKYGKYALGGLGAAAGLAATGIGAYALHNHYKSLPEYTYHEENYGPEYPEEGPGYAPHPKISKPLSNDFSTLGIHHGASKEDIKKAYHKLARKHHPDKNPGDPHAQARFQDLHSAYERLYGGKVRRYAPRRKRNTHK